MKALLTRHKVKGWTPNLSRARRSIEKGAARKSARDILSWYGGMGSFNDLIIYQINGEKRDKEDRGEINERLRRLQETIYLSARKLDEELWVMKETITLWRPTGRNELKLVEGSGWKRWPPRLPEQPIFYPVTNFGYAERIARDWNSTQAAPENVGFVTEFDVDADYALPI